MVTENVDIRFRESGARVIKRKVDEIGFAADRATRGIFLMQRALFVLGGFGAARALVGLSDALTNMENRLKLTTTSAANLQTVQSELFRVARDGRADLESVAEIYSRTALSVRELGISQKETIRFTESLAKASILSGASTREANAALIQLSQGLSSNRLSGDELRSVLEQLPFVADVIAKEMGITRGELRKFGSEGKISAQVVLEAFRNAEGEIDRLFSQTIPTISQAFSVARTNFLEFLDTVDDATGISGKLAKAIIVVSENLDLIVKAALGVAAAFAVSFGLSVVNKVTAFANSLAYTTGRYNRLNEVTALRAASSVRVAAAQVAENAANANAAGQNIILLSQNKARILQERASAAAYVKTLAAVQANTGTTTGLSAARQRLNDSTRALLATERAIGVNRAALATATAAQTGATATLTGANARLAAAQAVNAGFAARMAARFPVLSGAVAQLTSKFSGLSAVLFRNPFTAVVTTIFLATAAILGFGNRIAVTADGVVGLKDAFIASFQLIVEAITPAASAIKDGFSVAFKNITALLNVFTSAFSNGVLAILGVVQRVVNGIVGLFVGGFNSTKAIWDLLPAALADAGALAINALLSIIETGVKGILKAVNALFTFIGSAAGLVGADNPFENLINPDDLVDLSGFKVAVSGAASDAAGIISDEMSSALSQDYVGNVLGSITDRVTERARDNIDGANRTAQGNAITAALRRQELEKVTDPVDPTAPAGDGGSKKGAGSSGPSFQDLIGKMTQEMELLKLTNTERERAEELLGIEDTLKRKLTESENSLALATIKSLQAARTQSEVLQGILGPREEIANQQIALNQLFEDGRIGMSDYTTAIREMQVAAGEASGTLAGGFKAAILGSIKSANELGAALGQVVVGAASNAADAILDFSKSGKEKLREFFSDLFSQLFKLAANQLFTSLLGGLFPGSGALAGPTGGGGILGLLGFATGGSILPSGPGSTDSQVVQFAKRPDERVDILTPGQQKAQKKVMEENATDSSSSSVSSPNINVAVVVSEEDILRVFKGAKGQQVIIRGVSDNAGQVKRVLG